jgi:restriction system protein
VNHLPNPNVHIIQTGWLHEDRAFPYAAITTAIRRQQQVVIVQPLLPLADEAPQVLFPPLLLPTILEFGDRSKEGVLVRAIGFAWIEIVGAILRDPRVMHELDPRIWEELVAGGWHRAGADEVTLTPRSGDDGRDVIAAFKGAGHVRLFDQVKRYGPGYRVTADDVRAMIGTLDMARNVSKGFITTTAEFAPGIATHAGIQSYTPWRLELRDRAILLPWIEELAAKGIPPTPPDATAK